MTGPLYSMKPDDGFTDDDQLAATIGRDSINAFCLRELAFYLDQDNAGDVFTDSLSESLSRDGIESESHDAAIEYLASAYPTRQAWLRALAWGCELAAGNKARDAAKRAVIRFIQALWA
jgi:hypothetical protein